jgi:hypothetical protein
MAVVGADEQRIALHLMQAQPAERVWLVGDPATAIRVRGSGSPEVAPGILRRIEALAGTRLHVVRGRT